MLKKKMLKVTSRSAISSYPLPRWCLGFLLVSLSFQAFATSLEVTSKTIPRMTYLYNPYEFAKTSLETDIKNKATHLATNAIRRAKVTLEGPLTLIFDPMPTPDSKSISLQLGYPISGPVSRRGRFKIEKVPEFKCLTLRLDPQQHNTDTAWQQLYQTAQQQNLELTGEGRTVIREIDDRLEMELQLGIQ
ncbi:hypothetical protein [Oleiphilus messinensis]|nr:hypothetical protein [Oleiphilus messinensis]